MSIKISKQNLIEIGAVLTSIYGVLSSTAVLNHLPTSVSAILTLVGPTILGLFGYLNHPSTGTPTVPVSTPSGVVEAPIAPVTLVTPPQQVPAAPIHSVQ
jgi:hypothetical protein